jgi:putative (di)nucleoside polyphosphate hydrolase
MTKDTSKLRYRPNVGIMVINRDGLVWIGRRPGSHGDPEGRSTWWQMPQGGIDEGEDHITAALRELKEETGMHSVAVLAEAAEWIKYDLPPHLQGVSWGGGYRGQKQKWIAVRFTGADSEIDLTPPPGHKVEFEAWEWVPIERVMDRIVDFKREVYRAVINEFAHLAEPA